MAALALPTNEVEPAGAETSTRRVQRRRPMVADAHQGAHVSEIGGNGLARARVADVQRARILAAMVAEVAERGAANVSVAHVVARSAVSRRTFYEIFADREDCFLVAFDEAVGSVAASVISAYQRPRPWRERVRAALTALLQRLDSDRAMACLLIVESLAAGPKVLERRQSTLQRIVGVLDQGRAEAKGSADPPPLTAEGVIGGVLSVLHDRLTASSSARDRGDEGADGALLALTGALTGMIVLPYLGQAAARREIERPTPVHPSKGAPVRREDPLQYLHMRLTYRTMRVLTAVAEHPGASNRAIGGVAEIGDQGQISKLLARLGRFGLIENTGVGAATRGEPNAWRLTATGHEVHETIVGLESQVP